MKRALFLMIFFFLGVSTGTAQSPAKRHPKHYKMADIDATSISPDGRFFSYTDWSTGYLAIRDLKTGQSRNLTSEGWPKGAYSSKISPDGKHIGYSFDTSGGRDELRIIGADGTGERVLHSDPSITWINPHDWSADGKYVLAEFTTAGKDGPLQIALVPVAGGPPRVLKTFPRGRSPLTARFSPDGRYIAYDSPVEPSSEQRNLFVLAVENGAEIMLVNGPLNDLLLDWAPDGKAVLFAREHQDTWDLWAIRAADGKPEGRPELLRAGLMPVAGSLGFSRDGSLYYVSASWVDDLYVADLDVATGKLQPARKLINHVAWESSPAYSPDGKQLAYVLQRGLTGLGSLVLVIRSLETGRDREVSLNLRRFGGHAFQPHWSPDGRYMLVQGRDDDLVQGIYRIEAESGAVDSIVQSDTPCPMDCLEWPVLSPDGRVLFNRWAARSIVAHDITTGEEKAIYPDLPGGGRVSHLAVSPDGKRLAFVMWDRQTRKNLLKIMPSLGGEAVDLVELPDSASISAGQAAVQPAWTPDAAHIVYAVGTAGPKPKLDFWLISVQGGPPTHLGLSLEGLLPYGLSVHPGGQRIAFTAGTPRRSELWVLENFLPAFKTAK